MTIEQMRERKRELGYSAEDLAIASKVPVSTVRKIMSGATKSPRKETVQALEKALSRTQGEYTLEEFDKIPEGVHIELINGYLYARKQGKPLPQEIVDSFLAGEKAYKYQSDSGNAATSANKELIDGVIYDWASPTVMHQRAVMELTYQIKRFIEKGKHPCEVLPAPMDVKLFDDRSDIVEPDVIVICDSSKDKGDHIEGAPDFIAEVLSPSTSSNDLIRKLSLYLDAGVREYWIVDIERREITVYDFEADGRAKIFSFDERIPMNITSRKLKIDISKL